MDPSFDGNYRAEKDSNDKWDPGGLVSRCGVVEDPTDNEFTWHCGIGSQPPINFFKELFPAGENMYRAAVAGPDAVACSDVPPYDLRLIRWLLFAILVLFFGLIATSITARVWYRK